jgi:ribonuclease HI/retron-type reverse transcriptase
MGKLFTHTTSRSSLRYAWYKIRANGNKSRLTQTRRQIEGFERQAEQNINLIQRKLRNATFEFIPQQGVLKKKRSGGYRGIVMAPVPNRIVERALLDGLQEHVSFVQKVNSTETSIGGVPDRSVPHGLAIIDRLINGERNQYFIRADMSGFFDSIPRRTVLDQIRSYVDDELFLQLLNRASEVTLQNESVLGENRKVFPIDDHGVAQGSPLSPLFGNILLHEFDCLFNERNITCVRFVDDFLLIADKESRARKAFENAKKYLSNLGIKCHDPFAPGVSPEKAQYGNVREGFVFLGYYIIPGLMQPSKEARRALLKKLDECIKDGLNNISEIIRTGDEIEARQRYIQTFYIADRILTGWGNAFAYSQSRSTIGDLDRHIDAKIQLFQEKYQRKVSRQTNQTIRRAFGVKLLQDIPIRSLEDLPYRLERRRRSRQTQKTVVVSTDGSVFGSGQRKGKDRGYGGWAAVFHGDGKEIVGHSENRTNNEMELIATIEAIKMVPEGQHIIIRTDSQYVSDIANSDSLVASNKELWAQFEELCKTRRVDVVWVKGHGDDRFNVRADELANRAARALHPKFQVRRAEVGGSRQ